MSGMDSSTSLPPPFGLRQFQLKKAFRQCSGSLLESCSKEAFDNAFSAFNDNEREKLYQWFLKYVASLHAHIEKEFDIICQEMKVCNILDMVEELVEEQDLNCLTDNKNKIDDVKEDVLMAKKKEIQLLRDSLEKAEERNLLMKARVESLKSTQQNASSASECVGKMRSWMSDHLV